MIGRGFSEKSGGFLDRIHPLLTLVLSLAIVINGLLWREPGSLAAYFGVIVTIMLWSRLGKPMARMARFILPLALFIGMVNYLGFRDPVTAFLSGIRICLFGLSYVFFSATTTPAELVGALGGRVPPKMALGLIIAFRFIPVMLKELQDIRTASLLRPVRSSAPAWDRVYRAVLVPFVFRLVSISDEIYAGIVTRGFCDECTRSQYREFPWRRIDVGAVLFVVATVSLAVIL